jgi:hypothetical protein
MKLNYLVLIISLLFFCSKKVVKVEPANNVSEKPASSTAGPEPAVASNDLNRGKYIDQNLDGLILYLDEKPVKKRSDAPEPVSNTEEKKAEELKRKIDELEEHRTELMKNGSGSMKGQQIKETKEMSGNVKIDKELEQLKAELENTETPEEKIVARYEKLTANKNEAERKNIQKIINKTKEDAKPAKSYSISPNVSTVKAAAHDDNEEFAAYQEYCINSQFSLKTTWKIDKRYILKVVDKNEKPMSGIQIEIEKQKKTIWNAVTPASGEIVLFPNMDLGSDYSSIRDYSIKILGKNYFIDPGQDSYITIKLQNEPTVRSSIPLQICFLLDATGSMGDELQILKDVIFSIHSRLLAHPAHPEIEFSVVAYRDQGSKFVVKGYPFTKDIDTFQIQLESITAAGGGDEPEDLDTALQYVIDNLSWKSDAAKFTFLIADAPPHLDYNYKKDYMWAARMAREKAIMITPIGASGLGPLGEFIFRQIAVLTNGEFVFLSYGEKGESDGAGTVSDPGKVSHHTGSNYNSRRLDDIVLDIITKELGYLVSDPKLVLENRKPEDESDFLELRLTDLIQQVFRSNIPLQGKTVALAPFYAADTMLKATSEFLWESALEKTIQVAPVKVLERGRLEELLKENALELTGLTVENPDPKIGKMLSADFMTFGKVQYIGAVRVCHMRLVDCQTGSVVSAARIKL